MINSTLLSAVWLASTIGGFFLWRYLSKQAFQYKTRFRFYALRDRCVQMIVEGVVEESDPLFQAFYRQCNSLATDASRLEMTLHELVERFEVSVEDEQMANALNVEVSKRPEEFQDFVRDFYRTVWRSIVESNWMLQAALTASIVLPHCKRFFVNIFVPREPSEVTKGWEISKKARYLGNTLGGHGSAPIC